jgi:hypothetical protein
MSDAPGRSCPLHYRYAPSDLASAAATRCDVLYVAGGLYGNESALDALLALVERERGDTRLVFNGDFNWFNVDAAAFERINRRVLGFDATRGNVETELADAHETIDDAGCGCAYPDWVGDDVVARSNRIMQRLRDTARCFPVLRDALRALPMWMRMEVGGVRVGIVHGDAQSLAGWGFAQEHLTDAAHCNVVREWFAQAEVDIYASSHTCLPVFQTLDSDGASFAPIVLNNGAAGMPNFRHAIEGLVTRIATRPFDGPQRRFGVERGGLFLDAIALRYDQAHWQEQFLAQWPPGSAAYASYWQRIIDGPCYTLADALRSAAAPP